MVEVGEAVGGRSEVVEPDHLVGGGGSDEVINEFVLCTSVSEYLTTVV